MVNEFMETHMREMMDDIFKQGEEMEKEVVKRLDNVFKRIESELSLFVLSYGENRTGMFNRLTYSDYQNYRNKITFLNVLATDESIDPIYRQYATQLINTYPATPIESFILQMEAMFLMEQKEIEKEMTDGLREAYEETQSQTMYGIALAFVGVKYVKALRKDMDDSIYHYWFKDNVTGRIMSWRNDLRFNLRRILTSDENKSLKQMAKEIERAKGATKERATTLARTEMGRVTSEARAKAYEKSGVVKKYQFLATLDNRTSDRCQKLDNKVFKLKDRKVGKNAPPMHTNCRSTETPYFDDVDLSKSLRKARDKDGKPIFVPADMSYEQWKSGFGS